MAFTVGPTAAVVKLAMVSGVRHKIAVASITNIGPHNNTIVVREAGELHVVRLPTMFCASLVALCQVLQDALRKKRARKITVSVSSSRRARLSIKSPVSLVFLPNDSRFTAHFLGFSRSPQVILGDAMFLSLACTLAVPTRVQLMSAGDDAPIATLTPSLTGHCVVEHHAHMEAHDGFTPLGEFYIKAEGCDAAQLRASIMLATV